jgi:hypothetical protein
VKAIYGLYSHGAEAQDAVNRLVASGLAARDITVLSPEPREDLAFSRMHSRTWMWWIACAGGLIGFVTALGLALLTEMSWPLVVGGLPIVAWWPNLIIMFELTMLGAIAATVITLLVGGGLVGFSRGIYDPDVSNGMILVGVENPRDAAADQIERALHTSGNVTIRKL